MTTFLILDTTKVDCRCERCRHHKYVVLSQHKSGINVLHTFVESVAGGLWPSGISTDQGLHWWGTGLIDKFPPTCLSSYKTIGGKQ